MRGGYKYASLPADVQMAIKKIEAEAVRIRTQIASKEVQKRAIMAKIESLKESLRAGSSKERDELENSEKRIQEKGIVEQIKKKYAAQLSIIDARIAEIDREIGTAKRESEELRASFQQKPLPSEEKVLEGLHQQKNQILGQIQDFKNKLKDLEDRLEEVIGSIQRLSQKSLSRIPKKLVISTPSQLRVRQAEKEKLEKEKEKIQKIISGEIDFKKQELMPKKEKFGEVRRTQSSSFELKKLENSAAQLENEIQILKGKEGNLMRGIEAEVSKAKR